MSNQFINQNHPLLTRMALALAMLPAGIAAEGCSSAKSQAAEVIVQTNTASALDNLQMLSSQNQMPSADLQAAFGQMCNSVKETIGTYSHYEPETRIEPSCMEWAKGNNVNALGMKRAVSYLASDTDVSNKGNIQSFVDTVNRASAGWVNHPSR